jgi:hypothetical protein
LRGILEIRERSLPGGNIGWKKGNVSDGDQKTRKITCMNKIKVVAIEMGLQYHEI